jgi:hypothetical protein
VPAPTGTVSSDTAASHSGSASREERDALAL